MRTNNPDAILTSDWHYRYSTPICRIDDFRKTQKRKILEILGLQKKYKCPIINAGDIFHWWYVDKDSQNVPELISEALEIFPTMFSVPGNHEMPSHNVKNMPSSAYNILVAARRLKTCTGLLSLCGHLNDYIDLPFRVFGFPHNKELQRRIISDKKKLNGIKNVAVAHILTYKGRRPFPGADLGCTKVMRKLRGYDLIVTGDNHKPFTHKIGDQLLVNPGSITRQKSSETHKPRVYLWYAETNTVKLHYLKYDENAVTREHREEKEERDIIINELISNLKINPKKVDVDFEVNMKKFLYKNKRKIDKRVKEKIQISMEK